jgi:hypothetical protein
VIESEAEQNKILKLAQTLSDKGIGIDNKANEVRKLFPISTELENNIVSGS